MILVLEAGFIFNLFDFTDESFSGGIMDFLGEIFDNDKLYSQYYDFNKDWFDNVGIKISISLVVYMFSPHVPNYFKQKLKGCFSRCCARRFYFQKDLNEGIKGEDLDIAYNYSITLMVVYIACFYSAGMPFFYFFIFVHLFLNYWIEKSLILGEYSKSTFLDEKISQMVMSLMKLVIFVHLAQGAWIYSNPLYYPNNIFYKENGGSYELNGYYQLWNRV